MNIPKIKKKHTYMFCVYIFNVVIYTFKLFIEKSKGN